MITIKKKKLRYSTAKGRGLELLDDLESDFLLNGLKNSFFDMKYNFIERVQGISELLAWNNEIRKL